MKKKTGRNPIRKERRIICDGCGKEMKEVDEIHEIVFDPTARFPQLCGYGVKEERSNHYESLDMQG